MAEGESAEMSSSSLSGVRERMQEKKKGALRTARLNTSLASKIKTKIVSKYNSSIMKVSLKQNNKALALALNAEKANVQRLTREKTILQKEVKQCHFQNAVLRHRLSFLNNTLKKMDNLMAAVRMAELSEFHTNSASLSSGQKSSMTEDSWADDVADGQLLRIGMRVPISKLHDAEQQAGSSTAVQTSSGELQTPASDAGELQRLASNEPLKIVPIASKDTLLPQHDGKLQFHQEENSNKVTDTLATEEAFHDSHIFGEVLHTTEENPNNLPALACESHPLSHEADEMAKHFFHLSQRHITQRQKRPTSVARSTPYFALEILACVSPTQAAWGTTAQDNSSSSKNNTKQQLRSPSPLASPTQTAVISQRNSVGKETFCEQPQTKEMGNQKSNIKQIGGLQEKGQGEVHNNMNALKKEVSCKRSLFSHSLESSHVSSSGVLPVSSRHTEVSVSKSLGTEGKRMSAKSPVHLKNSQTVKKKTAEKIPGARNQVQSSSRSIPSKEPDIRPLQDLKNARALSRSGLEESSGRPSGQKWKPTCYKGPLINRKLRQGDPFTDRSSSTLLSTKENKKPVKAKAMTKKMKENQEGTPEECLGAKAMNA
ncbi:uncharacterized protein LOC131591204 isoform X1 [Poecile atricapillus]|uniref:uncharacterized protein LOC131591204 isoform X1 n=1 Tax=Poecile atricapillus TaxID=48891 RepID=UPI0027391F45|nr:uncharacterized protein LOC131591204 isoform X1 [Poecile atricapillus]